MEQSNVIVVSFRTGFIMLDVICTILGNVVSIFVINRVSEFPDSIQILMTSLCAADLGVGLALLSSIPSSAADRWLFGDPWCKITAGLLAVCLSMSVFSLLGVSVDRLVAIRWPLRHPMLITKRRVQIVCLSLWLLSAVIAAGNVMINVDFTTYLQKAAICYINYVPFYGIAGEVFTAVVLCVMPFTIIIVIYVNLMVISSRHIRRLRNNVHRRHVEPASSNGETSLNENNDRDKASRDKHVSNRKAIRTFLVVSLGFTLCWAPHFAWRLYGASATAHLPSWWQFFYAWLPMSNSFWNVIIYTLMNGLFREEIKKLIKRSPCYIQQRVRPEISITDHTGETNFSNTNHEIGLREPSIAGSILQV